MSSEKQVNHGGHREHREKTKDWAFIGIHLRGIRAISQKGFFSVFSVFSVVNEVSN